MTNKEILQKAIEKAEKNGYILNAHSKWIYSNLIVGINEPAKREFSDSIIFSHDFAKAFWGEEECDELCSCNLEYLVRKNVWLEDGRRDTQRMKCWEYQLKQMVLEKEPLKYLEKFL